MSYWFRAGSSLHFPTSSCSHFLCPFCSHFSSSSFSSSSPLPTPTMLPRLTLNSGFSASVFRLLSHPRPPLTLLKFKETAWLFYALTFLAFSPLPPLPSSLPFLPFPLLCLSTACTFINLCNDKIEVVLSIWKIWQALRSDLHILDLIGHKAMGTATTLIYQPIVITEQDVSFSSLKKTKK